MERNEPVVRVDQECSGRVLFTILSNHPEGDGTIRYVAFLRGINVGGHNQIRMTDLVRRLSTLGLKDVTSYKQSGNIIFGTDVAGDGEVVRMIEDDLASISKDVIVFLRMMSQVEDIIRSEPFKDRMVEGSMRYVTFLPQEASALKTPIWSTNKDVEVFRVQGKEAFSLAYKKGEHFGQPNVILERLLEVKATTRNWNSIEGIVNST
jgi:uncharacterized protein (DUF1697 family)